MASPPSQIVFPGLRAWQRKSRRDGLQAVLHQPARDPHPLARDLGAGLLQLVARFGQAEVHADLFQHRQRGLVDRFQLVVRQQRHRRKRPLGLAPRQLMDLCCAAPALVPLAAAPALRLLHCGLRHFLCSNRGQAHN
jgi:hypothetical protein